MLRKSHTSFDALLLTHTNSILGSYAIASSMERRHIARFYGSKPQFICCSATIANPGQLAAQLIENEAAVVEENGAPAAEKLFVFYNPPMVNRNLGIYLDFVRGGPPEPLVPVFHHNQMDLRGLAALSSRVLSLLRDPQIHGNDALELYGVSRIYERRGEVKRARQLYEELIASELPIETGRAARRSLARLAKRDGDFELACEQWETTLGSSRGGFESYEHLAIYYEHRTRDPQPALAIVQEALAELRRADKLSMISPAYHRRTRLRFEHRLKRLERKVRPMLLDTRKAALSAS